MVKTKSPTTVKQSEGWEKNLRERLRRFFERWDEEMEELDGIEYEDAYEAGMNALIEIIAKERAKAKKQVVGEIREKIKVAIIKGVKMPNENTVLVEMSKELIENLRQEEKILGMGVIKNKDIPKGKFELRKKFGLTEKGEGGNGN